MRPTRTTRTIAASALALLAAGCGGGGSGGDGSNAASMTASSASSVGAAVASGWKATDACAMMSKETVAATIGGTVKTATLGAVKSEGGGFPLYSQCEFLLEDGRMLVFGTGQSTMPDETLEHQVGDMRRQAKMLSDKDPVDLPGLGKAALWAADLNALYAFLGDGRYASATLAQTDFRRKQDPVETVKQQEMALLRKVGA